MTTRVCINGQVLLPEEATISVFDRGFLYGDSVFETVRTYGGRPYALDRHLARLEHSAGLVFIEPQVGRNELRREIFQTLAAAANPESYVRIMLTRGPGELGLTPAEEASSSRLIIVSELHKPPARAYEEGISVVTYQSARPNELAGAPAAKVSNYLVAVLAMRVATRVGALEALIVGSSGEVVEGATSNVFWLKDKILFTPPVTAGILPGITRDGVLRGAVGAGLRVDYRCPSVDELCAADEVFISSSIREVLPVVRIDESPVGDGRVGADTRRLQAAFQEIVEADLSTERG